MNPANFDFHCHSSISDGLLSPSEVVRRAAENGVTWLALTDDDDCSGLSEAAATATECGIDFLPGVEISIEWKSIPIHIVGLGVDADSSMLRDGLDVLRSGRIERARRMSDALSAVAIENAFEGAMRYAGNPNLISRAHFARYLVEIGICKDVGTVFRGYLTPGKPGYVDHRWATLEEAISWITSAGGVAVVAHPGRYRLSGGEMRAFLTEFRELGGQALEVACASHGNDHFLHFARLVRNFGFYASRGSDFHGPEESHVDLGKVPALPEDLKPVWRLLM
ncbi:MAG: 3',5'-nucleoside bisphosphate phosphatase [Betaproteobacteria bacterium]